MAHAQSRSFGAIEAPRVVIVGGGFAGLYAARALRDSPVQITLIDRSTVHLFKPLLYQCATGLLSEGQISSPLRALFRSQRNVTTLLGTVSVVDPANASVDLTADDGTVTSVDYDYLVVAAGVDQGYFGHPEYAEIAPGMRTLDDALTIRSRVIRAFETAETLSSREARAPWLTFALVGAGPTGVELAGQIRQLADHALRGSYRRMDPDEARVLLFDGGAQPLGSFGQKLSKRAAKTLQHLGVEFRPGTHVTHVDDTGVTVTDKATGAVENIAAGTVLWNAGITAPPIAHVIAEATQAEQEHDGRLRVERDLTVKGFPNVYVVGDLMSLRKLPGVAEVAMQSGRYAGRQIAASVAGRPTDKPFLYRDLGSAAYIGRGHALVEFGPVRLSGRLGWILWGVIHIAFLTGYRNRGAALLTWLTTLAAGRRRELVTAYGGHSRG
jgi:NADH dehydrogenase